MSDYGISVSKQGKSATSTQLFDLVMNTRYPFAKIDQTLDSTFQTTTVTILSEPTRNTLVEIYRFPHGYTYKPQMWGLWNITWNAQLGGYSALGYGTLNNTTGFPVCTFSYKVDETNVYLYVRNTDPFSTQSVIGTVATLTSYIFVDDTTDT